MPHEGINVYVVLVDTGWREDEGGAIAAVDSVFFDFKEAGKRCDRILKNTDFWGDDVRILEMPVRSFDPAEIEMVISMRPDGSDRSGIDWQKRTRYPLSIEEQNRRLREPPSPSVADVFR